MTNQSIQSNSFFTSMWCHIQRLRDPYFVSDVQKYFGIRVISNDSFDSNYSTTDPKTTKLLNGYRKDVLKNGKKSFKEFKAYSQSLKNNGEGDSSSLESTSGTEHSSEEEMSQSAETLKYVIENRFWYYLFCFGASLGYETFYAIFFPLWFWNIDGAVGRRLVLVWVIIMYFGQALKDVIRWPRPSSPPVIVLEPEYALEYGMPSTHAMVGSALPFSLIIFTLNRYEVHH